MAQMLLTSTARTVARALALLRYEPVPLLLGLSGWLVLAVTAVGALQPVRPFAVFTFALTVPGAALARLVPVREPLERAVLAVAMSISLAIAVSEATYIGHVLSPAPVLAGLAAICSAAAALEVARGRPRHRARVRT